MPKAAVHTLRRKLDELELAIFTGTQMSQGDVISVAGPLADVTGDAARERVRLLSIAAVGAYRDEYRARFGVCGVRPFDSSQGSRIWLLPIETFPNHVNNVYLVRGNGRPAFLYDAGSGAAQSADDFKRADRVLREVYREPGLDEVHDVVISHGHIDHFGGVGEWKARGCKVWCHEYDSRVITNFAERIVVSTLAVRAFLAHAGVPQDEAYDLEQMYVFSKNFFQPVPVDHVMSDGDKVFDYAAHHVPGHCPGQICLQVDNILLTADHVLPRITAFLPPESITPSTGLDHYLEALEKIRRVPGIDLALPGHEEPIEHLYQRIVEIEAFHRARLAKVLEICAGGARTVRDIALGLFGPRTGYDRILALQEAGSHVEYLARRGTLEIDNVEALLNERDPVIRYRAARSNPKAA